MMFSSLSSLTFAFPWVLSLFIFLPLLYWFLKIIPPRPREIVFPAMRLLLSLPNTEQTAKSIPWWLLLIRMSLAALIIVTLAGPRLHAEADQARSGPLVLLIDNNWQLAPSWRDAEIRILQLIEQAEKNERLIAFLPLATLDDKTKNTVDLLTPDVAKSRLGELTPLSIPLSPDFKPEQLAALKNLTTPEFAYVSSGFISKSDEKSHLALLRFLEELGPVTVYQSDLPDGPHIIAPPTHQGSRFVIPVSRAQGSKLAIGRVSGKDSNGKALFVRDYLFEAGKDAMEVAIDLPVSLINTIERLEIVGGNSAASIYLLDNRWQRPEIGIVDQSRQKTSHALLDELHYLRKALHPFFTIQNAPIDELIAEKVQIIILPDTGQLPLITRQKLTTWIERGGLLIRFSGPLLAASGTDFTPVRLRTGNRNLDGSISWSKPAALGPMPEDSPFRNLSIPKNVEVRKQVLAVPSSDLTGKIWAQLNDGTPLVTAAKMGGGQNILFHTTASTAWSNLVLSGLFVEMLREIGFQANNPSEFRSAEATLPPLMILDGLGRAVLGAYDISPVALAPGAFPEVSAAHPAGYYGDTTQRTALNVGSANLSYKITDFSSLKAPILPLVTEQELDLKPYLISAIFLLLLVDLIGLLYLQGPSIARFGKKPTEALTLLIGLSILSFFIGAPEALAEETEERILAATLKTRLGYIVTGDPEVDRITRAGMNGISLLINKRTSVEIAEPMPVNLSENELLFYPFVYWPMTADFPIPDDKAIEKIRAYMANGGTLVVDTRNQIKKSVFGGSLSNSPENRRLQEIMAKLDVPRLRPVPVDHVLTRAFYLMQAFPGRYFDGEVWLADTEDILGNDGVSPIIIGSNDWAAAWAIDESGRPTIAVSPGGPRQRELARRFGINLVMYTLTGSYKSDQVHIPAILERLGQ
ncbi:DUF4159 domain-containing protein [Sneathiella sp. P13V-1]|uniref:DUF4159 domain-containing protein n=1 Tax=Sneathiella sp. P13V-1 TaxID=2697366 RepID=UPI00187B25E1|nr:DUF4159 domain-containing protein [Sneathiella sp. P13V-1]MBE7635535.1 DUF4159 domain-containing protein [Sneathiella sp. P13V-1]